MPALKDPRTSGASLDGPHLTGWGGRSSRLLFCLRCLSAWSMAAFLVALAGPSWRVALVAAATVVVAELVAGLIDHRKRPPV